MVPPIGGAGAKRPEKLSGAKRPEKLSGREALQNNSLTDSHGMIGACDLARYRRWLE